jgi:hypothetical protein
MNNYTKPYPCGVCVVDLRELINTVFFSFKDQLKGLAQKVYTAYLQCYSVCPLVRIGTPRPPLPASEFVPPPEAKGGGHSPAGEGVAESQFGRMEKKPSTLSTLWPCSSAVICNDNNMAEDVRKGILAKSSMIILPCRSSCYIFYFLNKM